MRKPIIRERYVALVDTPDMAHVDRNEIVVCHKIKDGICYYRTIKDIKDYREGRWTLKISDWFKYFKLVNSEKEIVMTKEERINEKIEAIPNVCREGKDAIRKLMEEVTELKLRKKSPILDLNTIKIVKNNNSSTIKIHDWNVLHIREDGTFCRIKNIGHSTNWPLDELGRIKESG